LITIAGISSKNLIECSKTLMGIITNFDLEIPKMVAEEIVHDFKAVQLQENVNKVFRKLLKSWYSNFSNEDQKVESIHMFLTEAKGMEFLLLRAQNETSKSPFYHKTIKAANSSSNFANVVKSVFSDEEDDDENDNEFSNELLNYVGGKVGVKLTKGQAQSVLKKQDTQFLKPIKVVAKLSR
jgi:hypothetical protein